MWQSYGVWHETLMYLGLGFEATRLQALNRFCYDIAVSRVQTRIRLQSLIYRPVCNTKKILCYDMNEPSIRMCKTALLDVKVPYYFAVAQDA